MEKLEKKKEIINACRRKQLENVKKREKILKELEQSVTEYHNQKARFDSSSAQITHKKSLIAQQVQKARDEIDVLNKIDVKKQKQKAEFGAVVITDKQKIFLSIGLGEFKAQGLQYWAISPMSPLGQILIGKKPGEDYTFNGRKFRIKDVF